MTSAAQHDFETKLRVGGQFSSRMEAKDGSFGLDFAGTYTKIVPNRLIEYSIGDRTGVVEFAPEAKGVTVRVMFDVGPPIPKNSNAKADRPCRMTLLSMLNRKTGQQSS